MKISSTLKKITGLLALMFMINCSPTTPTGNQNPNSISTSFMDSCNPGKDASMSSVCNCAESRFREQNGGSVIRGVSQSEMNVAVSECRK